MNMHVESAATPQKNSINVWLILAAAVVLGLAAGFLGGLLGRGAPEQAAAQTAAVLPPQAGACDATAVAKAVLPSIVTISASNGSSGGVGSGEIVRSDGYIITNNHVIAVAAADGGRIEVLYSSGESVPATLVGRDPRADLAVLKVAGTTPLPAIALGSSGAVVVGQPVVALGAPLGLSGSVTSGIVSALGRDIAVPSDGKSTTILTGAVQTDASINPGNSGGALVDCSGKLIGINTAIATVPNSSGEAGGGSVGIGFAVPIDRASSIVDQLIATGKAVYPYFGVAVTTIPASVAKDYGVEAGLYIESVVAGGPADKAGLKPGDVITTVGGAPAATPEVLTKITLTQKAGDKVEIEYFRGGKQSSTTVALAEAP
ncbi:S1C family serine protease [Arthrobacter sp. 35W]|uniref:S1C family serine protease n=1 Tax=Arthrobacter sp. 35W TaxID=1132441 RepID=UPI0003FC3045|nr:trypsin-like peptidase domain-containing protein [Arthrobacter sp. 35W]